MTTTRQKTNDRELDTISIQFELNGRSVSVDVYPWESALTVLRDRLHLPGTKEGCGIGECGACTIIVDDNAVNGCLMFAPQLNGRVVLTVEGMGSAENLHALQKSFDERGAVQCGYCTPGMLLSALALLKKNPRPTRAEIIEALSGNLCRCTGYNQIIEAVEAAAPDRT